MSRKTAAIVPGGPLPIAWQLTGKRVLLVGGGDVAASRLVHLLSASPGHITLVSPFSGLCAETLTYLADYSSVLEHVDRTFVDSDVEGMDMVLTAIDEIGLSSHVCALCRERRIPVNVADVPKECDFYFGSTIRRGPLVVMVSTGGKGPRLARRIRMMVESALGGKTSEMEEGEWVIAAAIERTGLLRQELRKVEGGEDTASGKRRMGWMSQVCDLWSLSELAAMDEPLRKALLDSYLAGEPVKGYYETKYGLGQVARALDYTSLGKGRCPVNGGQGREGTAAKCPFVMGSSGFLVGAATALATVALVSRWSRR